MKRNTVLFVDDEPDFLSFLTRVLVRSNSLCAKSARNAEEAFSHIEKGSVQIIVSELYMEGLDGFEFLKRTKNEHPEIIRITLTGYADTKTVIKALNDEIAYRFIIKPLKNNSLWQNIYNAIAAYDFQNQKKASIRCLAYHERSNYRKMNTYRTEYSVIKYKTLLNIDFDQTFGYKTTSILVIPITDSSNNILSVLQLINRIDTIKKRIVPFPKSIELLMEAIAGQAALLHDFGKVYIYPNIFLKEKSYIKRTMKI